MSDSKEDKAKLKKLLKRLRSERESSYDRARVSNKEIRQVRGRIKKALAEEPKTIPTLAAGLELPSEHVLWHVMAMRKYGIASEGEQDGDYFRYQLVTKSEEVK